MLKNEMESYVRIEGRSLKNLTYPYMSTVCTVLSHVQRAVRSLLPAVTTFKTRLIFNFYLIASNNNNNNNNNINNNNNNIHYNAARSGWKQLVFHKAFELDTS